MDRKRAAVSAAVNALIIIFAAYSLGWFWFATGDGNMAVRGARSLIYFTNLSNLLAACTAVPVLAHDLRIVKGRETELPLRVYTAKFTGACSVAVTFLTTALFLAPVFALKGGNYFWYFAGNTFFLHFLTPVLAVFSAAALENAKGFDRRHAMWGLLPVVLYSIVYLYEVVFVGPDNGGWADFYGFTFGGNLSLAPVSAAVMYAATAVICLALYGLHRAVFGKRKA